MAERAALLTSLFLKGRLRSDLTDAEQAALEKCVSRTISIDPRSALVSRGQWTECSYLIVEGTMLRHIDGRKGERQLVTVNISGDFIDLHGYAMKRLDHDISSLTQCVLAQVPHEKITTLIEHFPHLGRALWFSTLLDAAMHREWIFALGRLDAEGRVAHLILELVERLRLVDQYQDNVMSIPLTQRDYSEACGITAVHANRIFRTLRERGALRPACNGGVKILDEDLLRSIAEFDGAYLYGRGELSISSLRGN